MVQELLGVMRSQPKILRLEFTKDGVPHRLRCCAGEHVYEILATESTLDGTHSHVVLNPPLIVGDLPRSNSSDIVEVGRRVRREVT